MKWRTPSAPSVNVWFSQLGQVGALEKLSFRLIKVPIRPNHVFFVFNMFLELIDENQGVFFHSTLLWSILKIFTHKSGLETASLTILGSVNMPLCHASMNKP